MGGCFSQNVKLNFLNGDKYEGNFKNDDIYGKGICYYKTGNKYEGEWENYKKHGKGIFISEKGFKYEGEWKNDQKHGKGIFIWKNGDKYEGEFKNNKKHGEGIFINKNGDKYEGEWNDDNQHGKGTIIFIKKDEGKWNDDNKHGKETIIFPDINMITCNYINNICFGYGIITYVNNSIYTGDILNYKPNGYGIKKYQCGKIEEGIWKNNILLKSEIIETNTECLLCIKKVVQQDLLLSCGNCNNKICNDCMNKHYIQNINNGEIVYKYKFQCPFCKQYPIIPLNSIIFNKNIIEIFQKYNKCGKCADCFNYCKINTSCDKTNIIENKNFTCDDCINKKQLNIKTCPKCKKKIIKDGGCDHMKCVCEYNFCWRCLKPWNLEHRCV
jgi:hypothetical protein